MVWNERSSSSNKSSRSVYSSSCLRFFSISSILTTVSAISSTSLGLFCTVVFTPYLEIRLSFVWKLRVSLASFSVYSICLTPNISSSSHYFFVRLELLKKLKSMTSSNSSPFASYTVRHRAWLRIEGKLCLDFWSLTITT